MIPVQQFLPAALAGVLRRAPLTPEKVEFAWRAAVGPAVANASDVELRNHVLQVRVKSGEWRREILRSTSLIRSRIEPVLGPGVVTSIDVIVL